MPGHKTAPAKGRVSRPKSAPAGGLISRQKATPADDGVSRSRQRRRLSRRATTFIGGASIALSACIVDASDPIASTARIEQEMERGDGDRPNKGRRDRTKASRASDEVAAGPVDESPVAAGVSDAPAVAGRAVPPPPIGNVPFDEFTRMVRGRLMRLGQPSDALSATAEAPLIDAIARRARRSPKEVRATLLKVARDQTTSTTDLFSPLLSDLFRSATLESTDASLTEFVRTYHPNAPRFGRADLAKYKTTKPATQLEMLADVFMDVLNHAEAIQSLYHDVQLVAKGTNSVSLEGEEGLDALRAALHQDVQYLTYKRAFQPYVNGARERLMAYRNNGGFVQVGDHAWVKFFNTRGWEKSERALMFDRDKEGDWVPAAASWTPESRARLQIMRPAYGDSFDVARTYVLRKTGSNWAVERSAGIALRTDDFLSNTAAVSSADDRNRLLDRSFIWETPRRRVTDYGLYRTICSLAEQDPDNGSCDASEAAVFLPATSAESFRTSAVRFMVTADKFWTTPDRDDTRRVIDGLLGQVLASLDTEPGVFGDPLLLDIEDDPATEKAKKPTTANKHKKKKHRKPTSKAVLTVEAAGRAADEVSASDDGPDGPEHDIGDGVRTDGAGCAASDDGPDGPEDDIGDGYHRSGGPDDDERDVVDRAADRVSVAVVVARPVKGRAAPTPLMARRVAEPPPAAAQLDPAEEAIQRLSEAAAYALPSRGRVPHRKLIRALNELYRLKAKMGLVSSQPTHVTTGTSHGASHARNAEPLIVTRPHGANAHRSVKEVLKTAGSAARHAVGTSQLGGAKDIPDDT